MTARNVRIASRFVGLSALLALTLNSGCQLLSAVLFKTKGANAVPAQYTLPKQPTLVFVESYNHVLSNGFDPEQLNYALVKTFKENDLAPTIDPQKLEKLRDTAGDAYRNMTIASIGRNVGAKQIVYVNITRAEIDRPSGGGAAHGIVGAQVKVIDASTAETLWPSGADMGQPVVVPTEWVRDSNDAENKVRSDMAVMTADTIGKLFYAWTPKNDSPGARGEEGAPQEAR